ncbi:MAG: hypothetical protein ACFFBP_11525 [Promethearchaeota archaeon]
MSIRIPDRKELNIKESSLSRLNEIDEELSSYLKENWKNPLNDNLLILRKLHKTLQKYQDLTTSQRLDYCNSERYFMKLYLKDIARRNKRE